MKPGDPITLYRSNGNGAFTLWLRRVGWAHENFNYFKFEGAANMEECLLLQDEGVTWVRGHVTRRHKIARAMIAAQALIK